MPRANRHYIPGYVWHITHRCHKRDFLLKFGRDKRRWMQWLFEARKRHGLSVLSYTVTSNHIHLLVRDNGERDVIPSSMQLIAGRTGQEYNLRKQRKGAYWEDRYHATAVETDRHLIQCMIYIDMNMVRAGVVKHPSEWPLSGYSEIQAPRERYSILDYEELQKLLNFRSMEDLAKAHRGWVEDAVLSGDRSREEKWTESIAVGSGSFVAVTKEKLGIRALSREVMETDGGYLLREPSMPYKTILPPENDDIRLQNGYYWDDTDGVSAT